MPSSKNKASIRSYYGRFLAWANGVFKTDAQYLIHGMSWSTIAQIVASGCAFVLSLFISRLVSKDVYGEYKYILAIISILSTLSLNNIGGAVFQSTARGFDGVLAEGFKENIRWSIAIFIGALAFGAYYLLVGNATLGIGILIGGCITPFLASTNLYNSYLLGKKDFALQAWYGDIVTNIIPTIALIITAFIAPRPLPLIAIYFISNFFAALYAYIRAIRRYRPDPTKKDPGMMGYAKHLSVIGILSGIAGNIDQVLLFHYTDAATLAIYNFATGIIDQTKGPLKTLDAMMQVKFAPAQDASISSGMRNKYIWLLAGSILVIVIYIVLAPFIYKVVFPNYVVAVPYSQVYALSLIATALAPASSYLSAKKRVYAQYVNTVANSVFQIVLMAIGTVVWGLWGLIFARLITRVVGGILTYGIYKTIGQESA